MSAAREDAALLPGQSPVVSSPPPVGSADPSKWRALTRGRGVKKLLPVVSVLVFLTIWQIVGARINPILLATPSAVGQAFVDINREGLLWPAFSRAMEVLVVGLGIAGVAGIAIGVLMGRSDTAYRTLNPYVAFFQATPLIALTPLVVIWFGIGFQSEVAVTVLLAVWSVIINTSEGVRNTPESLLDMARIYQASERSVIRQIALPHAIPYMFAGLRIALAKGMIGVIIAEMDVSLKGLGGLVEDFGNSFQTARLLAAIITSSCVGVIGTIVLELVRRRVAPWAGRSKAKTQA